MDVNAVVALMGAEHCRQDGYQVRRDSCFYRHGNIKNAQRSGICNMHIPDVPQQFYLPDQLVCTLKICKGAYFLPRMCNMHIGKANVHVTYF